MLHLVTLISMSVGFGVNINFSKHRPNGASAVTLFPSFNEISSEKLSFKRIQIKRLQAFRFPLLERVETEVPVPNRASSRLADIRYSKALWRDTQELTNVNLKVMQHEI